MKTLEELKQEMGPAWADWWDAVRAAARDAAWEAARDAYNKKLREIESEDT